MSGDFIVGFPGETDADFEATLELVRTVHYAQAYSFKYSPRPGTPGADMKDHVAEAVKDERLQRLQALLTEQHARIQRRDGRQDDGPADREAGPPARPAGWTIALAAARYC